MSAFDFSGELVWAALSNTLFGGTLAVLGLIVWRTGRRLALAHALVLLGTLKLVTPSLIHHPVAVPTAWTAVRPSEPTAGPPTGSAAGPLDNPASARADDAAALARAGDPPGGAEGFVLPLSAAGPRSGGAPGSAAIEVPVPRRGEAARVDGPAADVIHASPLAPPGPPTPWLAWVVCGWGAGAVLLLAIGWRRSRRCRTLLEHAATGSPQLQREVEDLAARLRLRRVPDVRVVDANVSPFVLAVGGGWRRPGAVVVVPRALLARLDAEEVRAVLAHELAHLAGADHWVRRLEVLVAALHWWNPVAHWMRACLRHLEEIRCDSRAVAVLDSGKRHYGRTLLKATAHLDGDFDALPLSACGLGGAKTLKTRLMMMTGVRVESRLSPWARGAVALGAASLLPLGLAAQDPKSGEKQAPEVTRVEVRRSPGQSQSDGDLRAELKELRSMLDRVMRELDEERGATRHEDAPRPRRLVDVFGRGGEAGSTERAPSAGRTGRVYGLAPRTEAARQNPIQDPAKDSAKESAKKAGGSADRKIEIKVSVDGKTYEAHSLEELRKLTGEGGPLKGLHVLEKIDFDDLHFGGIELGDVDFGDMRFGAIDLGDLDFGEIEVGEIDVGDLDVEFDFDEKRNGEWKAAMKRIGAIDVGDIEVDVEGRAEGPFFVRIRGDGDKAGLRVPGAGGRVSRFFKADGGAPLDAFPGKDGLFVTDGDKLEGRGFHGFPGSGNLFVVESTEEEREGADAPAARPRPRTSIVRLRGEKSEAAGSAAPSIESLQKQVRDLEAQLEKLRRSIDQRR